MNLGAHRFLDLTQFKLASRDIVPRAGLTKALLKPSVWSTGRDDWKPLRLVLHKIRMRGSSKLRV